MTEALRAFPQSLQTNVEIVFSQVRHHRTLFHPYLLTPVLMMLQSSALQDNEVIVPSRSNDLLSGPYLLTMIGRIHKSSVSQGEFWDRAPKQTTYSYPSRFISHIRNTTFHWARNNRRSRHIVVKYLNSQGAELCTCDRRVFIMPYLRKMNAQYGSHIYWSECFISTTTRSHSIKSDSGRGSCLYRRLSDESKLINTNYSIRQYATKLVSCLLIFWWKVTADLFAWGDIKHIAWLRPMIWKWFRSNRGIFQDIMRESAWMK
jgi:hypothetical protein